MTKQTSPHVTYLAQFLARLITLGQKGWPIWLTLALVTLTLLHGTPLAAKRLYQTVPDPTATPQPTSVPQATDTPQPSDPGGGNQGGGDQGGGNNSPTATSVPTTTEPKLTGMITANVLNVRQGPGSSFPVVGKLLKETKVEILQRDPAGNWWLVCCLPGVTTQGWVSAQFVQPSFDRAQANQLVPVAEVLPTPPPTPPPAPATAITTTELLTQPVGVSPYLLTITQRPAFVWSGQQVALHFVLTNTGTVAGLAVEIRDELPPELTFVAAEAGSEGTLSLENGTDDHDVAVLRWPQLDAGASVTATILVQVADGLPAGSVIDNLAVAGSTAAPPYTAGVSIGMPPATLPDFQ